MTVKKLLPVAAWCLVCHGASAGMIDVGADFSGEGCMPPGWEFRSHNKFKPDPVVELTGESDGCRFLRITEIRGESGTAFGPKKMFPAKAGDTLEVSIVVRGKGVASVNFARHTAQGRWCWLMSARTVDLSSAWTRRSFDMPVEDSPAGETAQVQLWLGAKKGTELEIREMTVRRRRTSVPGASQMVNVSLIARDDYEKPDKRPGSPKLVSGEFAPGIPKITKRGRYTVNRIQRIKLPGVSRVSLPAPASNELYFTTGVRIYEQENAKCAFLFGTDSKNISRVPFPSIPPEKLPAEVAYAVDADGSYTLILRSLADASVSRTSGYNPFFDALTRPFVSAIELASGDGAGTVQVDEYTAGYAKNEVQKDFPHKVTPDETFDPSAAGWPLVFTDDFSGSKINREKWFVPPWRRKHASLAKLDGRGNLVVSAEPDPDDPGILRTTGLWTKQSFLYGYFEARLKFTFKPGWWAAFWLYGICNRNPFLDGLEIDMFEDYPSRGKTPVISHNLHNNVPTEASKSWSFHSQIPSPVEGYHVFGCKWTPFEISEYIDGRLIRTVRRQDGSGGDGVSFNGLDTVVCTVPLHVIFSGSLSKSMRGKIDFAKYGYPDDFVIDWVKVYGWPGAGKGPGVSWKGGKEICRVNSGETLRFEVETSPASAPVKTVYLFDNGYPIAFKEKPPYVFEVPFSREHYGTTRYMTPGRSGVTPPFDGYVHAFVAFAEDEKGNLSFTKPLLRLPASMSEAKAWDGGRFGLVRSVQCLRYEYDAGGGGRRTLKFKFSASPELQFDNRCHVLLDGEPAATLKLPCSNLPSDLAEAEITFPPGRHELMFVPVGIFSVFGMEIE